MAESVTPEVRLPDYKPPALANSFMKWMLTTPGLQSIVGQGVALLAFTGRKTGRTYTIPVSYRREDDVVTVVTERARKWWHNLETPTEVTLRLAGRDYTGGAHIVTGDEQVLRFMLDFLEKRPMDAKAYGMGKQVTEEGVARIVPDIVVIRARLLSSV